MCPRAALWSRMAIGTWANSHIIQLSNDPLALDNINKFKVGDRVICNDNGVIGTVKELDIPNEACVVDFDNGEEDVWIEKFQLSKE